MKSTTRTGRVNGSAARSRVPEPAAPEREGREVDPGDAASSRGISMDSAEDARPDESARQEVVVGVVGRPWGTKGQFLVDPRGSDPDLLLSGRCLRVRRRGRGHEDFPVLGSHFAAGRLVVQIEGCGSPEEAEELRGAEVVVPAAKFSPAPEGSYYPHELAGLRVFGPGGDEVGRVERVMETVGPDLLIVRKSGPAGKEIMIPFARAICRVNREQGRIDLDPPDGLLDLD